ncbi:RNA polymerase sigma factor [Phytohabitans rumicis]|uniref:DNA-directed RNA polymerase sigma-70 factor n=1 Tax=Phytohabitans rumicis TaxID=1076125 RepID=A0A6V8L2P3_9ACTN|nr:RNA polymerase sigma factor [Phytohabitans rumicis]GFJ88376.1 hypothetical protein Prum_020180 [Phytohabitans rumicis]
MRTDVARDRAWHDDLCRQYHSRVMRVAAALLEDHWQDAEEVAQETFMTAWVKREVVGEDPWPWLYVTARNHVRTRWRQHRKRFQAHLRSVAEPVAPYDGGMGACEDRQDLVRAWRSLRVDDRELLLLSCDGTSDAQTAEILRITPAAVRKRRQRARDRLRKALEAMDAEIPMASVGTDKGT